MGGVIMAFTEKVRGTYGFHEQTLSDRTFLVKNETGRTVLQHELVIINGVFGNVLEHKGIANGASGLVNINNDRTIKTAQLHAGTANFTVGGTVYAIAGDTTNPVMLTHSSEGNTAVGRVIEIDPASPQAYVVFRPFVQPVPLDVNEARIAGLEALDAGTRLTTLEGYDTDTRLTALEGETVVKTLKLEIDGDAKTAPINFGNATTGLEEGDIIVDVVVLATATEANGTMQVTHGAAGADITDAIDASNDGVATKASTITSGVITAAGLDVKANGADDRANVYVMYIKG